MSSGSITCVYLQLQRGGGTRAAADGDSGLDGPVARRLLPALTQGASPSAAGGGAAAPLQQALSAQLAQWLASPYLEGPRAEELLGALTEDMVGW